MYNRIGRMTKPELQEQANKVVSIAGLIKLLGYKNEAGGTYSVVKKYLQLYEIDTTHWKGQAWSKDKKLKDWSKYATYQSIKRHLMVERGHRCEGCGLSEWKNHKITIELHHVDGNRTNNLPENLELLCPNCHAMTDTWKGRNK